MKTTYILALCLFACALAAEPIGGDEPQAERSRFARAYDAQSAGRRSEARKLIAGLENYPLYPYYRYFELNRGLPSAASKDVNEFLTVYDDSYLAERLRHAWLKHLGKKQSWDEYLKAYRPQSGTQLKCTELTARLKTAALDGVADAAREIWLTGKSLPSACDIAFKYLKDNNFIDDSLIWQRLRLALANNAIGLANYLERQLKGQSVRVAARHWLAAHKNPARALKNSFFTGDTDQIRDIVVHAVGRLARKNVEHAESVWNEFSRRQNFTPDEVGNARRALAHAAASQDHRRRIALLDQVPAEAVDTVIEKYRIREAIKESAWEELVRWTKYPPVGDMDILRWRYWRARALQQLERTNAANMIFRELAKERDYYGFLSADQLSLGYRMNDRPVRPTKHELDAIRSRPGIMRARELYLLDMQIEARREWMHEVEQLNPRELEVAAFVVDQWGWHDRAIFALGKAQSYDDLEIRFPLKHEDLVRRYAKKRGLSAEIIYSIIRTESAFMRDARSSAGALGLMQLMPATGRETARRIGAKLTHTRDLLNPDTNVVIGSAYLKQMLDRFSGSFTLAAAAYNAGPHRARDWRPKSGCVPADIWIDTIPFTETRRYVRRASFYATVYQWRLNKTTTPLSALLRAVTPNATRQQC